jgi:sulfhydrogenase subunit beta (sulfur reductase)
MIKIEKKEFNQFIDTLLSEYTVYAPAYDGKITAYGAIKSAADVVSDIQNTDKPPKEIFFPPAEVLFSYGEKGVSEPEKNKKPFAVWGARPCDARSFPLLDKVFGRAVQNPKDENFQDPFWKEKYDNVLIFGLGCNKPASTCFCHWFQSGPFSKEASDVFVVDTGEAYILESVSKKGDAYLFSLRDKNKASAEDEAKIKKLKKEAEACLGESVDLKAYHNKLKQLWDDPVWDEISAKCLNCAACAFSCPTCHCFDVDDEGKGKKGKRIRIWDSCMFPLFTKEASGHNPRSSSKTRVRQRFMHKLSYFFENYSEYLCTGCGRCVQVCPVNLDIREVIKRTRGN